MPITTPKTLRRYEVWVHGHETELKQTVVALNASKAKYHLYLDLKAAGGYDFSFQHLRTKSLGPVCKPRALEAEERKILEIMRHAMGLNQYGLDKHGGWTGYRNHYALYTTSDDYGLLVSLCTREVPMMGSTNMEKLAKDMVYFHVTIHGLDWVRKRTGLDHTETPA